MIEVDKIKSFLDGFPGFNIYSMQAGVAKGKQEPCLIDDIEIQNSPAKKKDIFFSIISDSIYTLSFFIDGTSKTREGLLNPSMILNSPKGNYIFIKLDKEYSKVGNQDAIKKISSNIAKRIGAIVPIGFPMPSTQYWADNTGDQEISIKTFDTQYSLTDLTTMFIGYDEVLWKYGKDKEKYTQWPDIKQIFEEIESIDASDVLEKVSGGKFTTMPDGSIHTKNGEVNRYAYHKFRNTVNCFTTESTLDKPRGNAYTIAKQALKISSLPELIQWFKSNYELKCDEAIKQYQDRLATLNADSNNIKIIDKDTYIIGYGSSTQIRVDKVRKEMVLISNGKDGENVERLVSGIIEPVGFYKIGKRPDGGCDRSIIIIKVDSNKGINIIPLTPFSSAGEFRKFLMKQGIDCAGNSAGVKLLSQYILNTSNEYEYTESLGLQEIFGKRFFVRTGGRYIVDGLYVNIETVDDSKDQIDVPQKTDMGWPEIVEILFRIYEPKVIYPLFLTSIGLVYSRFFRDRKLQLPGLFIEGLKASGKTTLKRLILNKMLGMNYSIPAASSNFVLESSLRHAMPISIEEFRNDALKDGAYFSSIVRTAFDGQNIMKGTQTLTTVSFPIVGQFIIDGQTKFNDAAAISRNIVLMCAEWKRKPDGLLAMQELPGNIMSNVLEIFKDEGDINRMVEEREKVQMKLVEIIDSSGKNYGDSHRISQCYGFIIALARRLGLEEHEHYLVDTMFDQLVRDDSDDIAKKYIILFNHFNVHRGMVEFCDGGCFVDVNLDMSRFAESVKVDIISTFKTINENFNKLRPGQSCYVDFKYIEEKPQLRQIFKAFLNTAGIPSDIDECEQGTYGSLKKLRTFLEKKMKGTSSLIEEIDSTLNYMKFKTKKTDDALS